MRPSRFALIMAGGRGTRFWPVSRAHYPKQLLKILSRKSLIRETADRVIPLVDYLGESLSRALELSANR